MHPGQTTPAVIRKLGLSLKLKITFLVMVVLLFTIFLVLRFNIRQQNAILREQQEQTMSGYLLPFRQNLIRLFLLNEKERDLKTLQEYVLSFKNIPSFKMAMFVDMEGDILFHSDSRSVGARVSQASLEMFHTNYSDQIHSDFRFFEAEIQTYTTKKGDTRAYTNDRIDSYDGYLPIYMDYPGHRSLGILRSFEQDLRKGLLFRSRRLPLETQQGFRFAARFQILHDQLFRDGKPTPRAQALLRDRKITSADLRRIRLYQDYLESYKSSGDLLISPQNFEKLMESLVSAGLSLTEAADFIKWKENNSLFSHRKLLDPEQKRNLRFLVYIEELLKRYTGSPEAVKNLTEWQKLVSEKNIRVSPAWYNLRLRTLQRQMENYQSYRTQSRNISPEQLEKTFAELFAFYRLGTVRVILNLEDLSDLQKQAANRTMDTAAVFILRMLVIVFLAVAYIISPLNTLGLGTTEVAQGNLDKIIEIPGRDEIGQLADKFNYMTHNLKKAFAEIQDKTRMEEELRIAREIQTAILPQALPELPGYRFAVCYQPQTESGGDYYDFIELGSGMFGVVVADVTNHGVGAAMVMSVLRSALRSYSQPGRSAAQVLKDINPVLLRDTPPNMFATIFYGILNLETREMRYSSAGHNQGIIYSPEQNRLRLLKAGGIPAGMLPAAIFDPQIEMFGATLQPGDFFLQYSDGITEAKSAQGEEYGEDRFYDAIRRHCQADLDVMRDNILSELAEFTRGAGQSDDITLILMHVEKS